MTLVVQIRRQQFDVEREYREGDTLTAGEALAMNQLLVERVRRGVAPWVARAVRAYGVLTTEQHNELQDKINNFASRYQFDPRPGYRPEVPMESAVKEVALQSAEQWGQRNGLTPDSPEVRQKYISLCSDPVIRDQARELIRNRIGVVEALLEDLL